MKLIPSSEVFMSKTHYPPGWFVAEYDDEGMALKRKWFPVENEDKAKAYKEELEKQN